MGRIGPGRAGRGADRGASMPINFLKFLPALSSPGHAKTGFGG
jgi:hypothetical protein